MVFPINKYSRKFCNIEYIQYIIEYIKYCVLFSLITNTSKIRQQELTRVFAAMYPCADLSETDKNTLIEQILKVFCIRHGNKSEIFNMYWLLYCFISILLLLTSWGEAHVLLVVHSFFGVVEL